MLDNEQFDADPQNARDWFYAHRMVFWCMITSTVFWAVLQLPHLVVSGWTWVQTTVAAFLVLNVWFTWIGREKYLLPRYYFYARNDGPYNPVDIPDLIPWAHEIRRQTFIYYDDFVTAKLSEPNLISRFEIDDMKKDFDEMRSTRTVPIIEWKTYNGAPNRLWNFITVFAVIAVAGDWIFRKLGWLPARKEDYYDY